MNPSNYFDNYLGERLNIIFLGHCIAVVLDQFNQRHHFQAQHVRNEIARNRRLHQA